MAQQTPLTLLLNYYNAIVISQGDKITSYDVLRKVIKKAAELKEMEKEQIKLAFNQGYRDAENDCCESVGTDVSECANAENYYNETFGK
jgi:hypothetical protein